MSYNNTFKNWELETCSQLLHGKGAGVGGDKAFWGHEWSRLAVKYNELINFNLFDELKDTNENHRKFIKILSYLSRTKNSR